MSGKISTFTLRYFGNCFGDLDFRIYFLFIYSVVIMVIRVTKIIQRCNKVMITVEGGANFVADAAVITVPLGVLKANMIEFDPKLPEWKVSAISDLGVGNENKIALHFSTVFWPNVEVLGVVAPTSYACGYFLNLHKATGHPVLVYMAAGRVAYDIEKLSDEEAVKFVMLQLQKMLPDATEPVRFYHLFLLVFVLKSSGDLSFRMIFLIMIFYRFNI